MSTQVTERGRTSDQATIETRRELAPRTIVRRLPPSRAIIGGLLIALAAGGVFVAHRGANTPPTTRFLVVTVPVQMGSALTERHLGSVALDLPDGLSAVQTDQLDEVLGRVARTPLEPMDLLRPADLYEPGRFTHAGSVEVAVDLPPARALHGVIRAGSVVDVLATDPAGSGTTTIASGVPVIGVGADSGDEIGARGTTRIRLSLPSAEMAEQLVDAAVRSEVTLTLPAPPVSDRPSPEAGP